MPSLSEITSSPMLREFAQGAAQSAVQPVADFLAPTVEVPSSIGRYKIYTEKNRFLPPATARAIGGRATVLSFDATDSTYNCQPNALDFPIDFLEQIEEAALANALMEGATIVAEVAALAHEQSVINTALASTTPGAIAKTWSGNSGTDPIDDLDQQILNVIKAARYGSLTLNIPQYAGGVTSFDTRSGAITLTAADINATGTINVVNQGSSATAASATTVTSGGGFMESSNSTDTLTFSPGLLYNTIEVYYVINPGNGSITVNNGGSSLGTTNTAGTAAIGKQTYSVSLTNNPVNIQATSSTVTYIAGVICYNTNTPGVLFINAGMGNATTGSLLGTGWNAEGSIAALAPDLSIVNLMINDCNNGAISSSTYQSNLSSLVTYCQNYGSVMLVTPVPGGATTYLANATAFLAATKAVASSDNTALVDVSSLMPSYSVQNTLGLRFDTLHPNAAGYQYYSSLLANELLQICAPTAATQVTQTTVSGSTAGSAVFSEPNQGAAYKKVIVQLGSSLSGTASYTFPSSFANTPVVVNSDAAVTTLSTTGVTITGTLTLPRTVVLEGY